MLAMILVIENEQVRNKAIEIYNTYYGTMLGTAKKILSDVSLAEDAVSEAFIKIINNLDKIHEISRYETRGYIVIIVRNTALDMLRKQKRQTEVPIDEVKELADNDSSILEKLSMEDACNSIVERIKSLPKSLSDVLYLFIVLEYTYDEISNLLGISRDAVKMRLSRAKKKVQVLIQEDS